MSVVLILSLSCLMLQLQHFAMLDTEPLRIALEQATGDLKGRRTVGEATVHPINEAARYVAQNLDERYVVVRAQTSRKAGRKLIARAES